VFTADAVIDEEPLGASVEGADVYVALVRELSRDTRTVHHCHMPELVVDGPTEARGTWTLADYVEWAPDPETGERRGFEAHGRYEETYRKVDGEWRIARLRCTYGRLDPLPRTPLPPRIQGGPSVLDDA
jgi:hypothetical protein